MSAPDLRTYPVHLGLGGTVRAQPEFTGMDWYECYARRVDADGGDRRLVSMHDFTADWDSWEVHPSGDELVVCLSGEITLIQERQDGSMHSETIRPGQYLINPAGVWHTANVAAPATALFITAGDGTDHRPR